VELETARLRLRPWRTGDLDAYVALFADPEVVRYISGGRPLPR
jgi:RimJ/RimL family protein N-acetyltransferase